MKDELKDTIHRLEKINSFLKKHDTDFDKEDVVETFENTKERLHAFLKEFEKMNLEDRDKVNELLVYMKLEYANFIWCFEQMRDFIDRTLVRFPD